MPLDRVERVRHRDPPTSLRRQRRGAGIAQPAGHDLVEPGQVTVAVQHEAVHRDAARDPDADGRDLAVGLAGASAGQPDSAAALDQAGLEAEVCAHPDQRGFDQAHVRDDVDGLGQRDDRVPGQLAGAVPGDLAAAVHVDHRRAGIAEGTVERVRAAPRGVDGPVLQQQAGIGNVAAHPLLVQLSLQVPHLQVVGACAVQSCPREYQVTVHSPSLCPVWWWPPADSAGGRAEPPHMRLLKMYRVR